MEYNKSIVVIDAVPQDELRNINENISENNVVLSALFDDFTINDYKSIFFLLMDYVKLDSFFDLTKQDKCYLKQALLTICRNFNSDEILIELLGIMKMKKKLRLLNTCYHIYKKFEERNFSQIDGFWKMLYLLSEEVTDEDLNSLKQTIPDNFKEKILSAEEWFCWGLLNNFFSKSNTSKLEEIFKDNKTCLNIIRKFQLKDKLYQIRTPTLSSNIGIAVIMNFETFNENSKLLKRTGSNIDVERLKSLWTEFGFQTYVHKDLKFQETLDWLGIYAKSDHSNHDAFVCCILSHGKENSIYTSDGQEMLISDIVSAITCESLASKPKLFFIQACQGSVIHQGVGKPIFKIGDESNAAEEHILKMPPITSDVLIALSSINGYVSYRDVEKGSWFVEALCEIMMQIGDESSIHDVMTAVNNEVNAKKVDYGPKGPRKAEQIPNFISALKKTLILKKRIK